MCFSFILPKKVVSISIVISRIYSIKVCVGKYCLKIESKWFVTKIYIFPKSFFKGLSLHVKYLSECMFWYYMCSCSACRGRRGCYIPGTEVIGIGVTELKPGTKPKGSTTKLSISPAAQQHPSPPPGFSVQT